MIALVAAAFLSFDPATAVAAVAPVAAPVVVADKAVKEKKICKVATNESSSRLRKRTCMTAPEWQHLEAGKDMSDLNRMSAH